MWEQKDYGSADRWRRYCIHHGLLHIWKQRIALKSDVFQTCTGPPASPLEKPLLGPAVPSSYDPVLSSLSLPNFLNEKWSHSSSHFLNPTPCTPASSHCSPETFQRSPVNHSFPNPVIFLHLHSLDPPPDLRLSITVSYLLGLCFCPLRIHFFLRCRCHGFKTWSEDRALSLFSFFSSLCCVLVMPSLSHCEGHLRGFGGKRAG